MKKLGEILLVIMCVFFLGLHTNKVSAKEPVNVYFFHLDGCRYCQAALAFFESIEEEYGDKFNLVKYEVGSSQENSQLFTTVAAKFGMSSESVPFFAIGDQPFSGYSEASNEKIIDAIETTYEKDDRYDALSGEKVEVKNNTDVVAYVVMAMMILGSTGLLIFARVKTN